MTRAVLLLAAGCSWVSGAEYDARLDLDGDGVPWPDDCAPDDPAVSSGCGDGDADTDSDSDSDSDADADSDSDADADTGDTGCDGPDADGDGVPDACDGCPDEPTLSAPAPIPTDADGDGFGADVVGCDVPAVPPRPGDCDDGDVFVNPIAREVPGNAVDEDCDGVLRCFADADGDGLGDIEGPVTGDGDGDCADPGESTAATDCDDADAAAGAGGCADQPPIAVLAVHPLAVEAGATVHLSAAASTDAEDPAGTLEVRFDLEGDGVFDTPFGVVATADAVYAAAGLVEPVVEVRDAAGHLTWATAVVAVADPGALLVVDTDADDADPEPFGGPYTAGLTLREAISLANGHAGFEVVTFADRFVIGPGTALPLLSADDATIAGVPGLVLDGAAAGGTGLSLTGDRDTVLGLRATGWGTALAFSGADGVARQNELDGNGAAVDLDADDVRLVGNDVHDNTGVQLVLARRASVEGGRVIGGTNAIVISASADDSTIRGVTIALATGDCVVLEGTAGGADDVVITDTTITSCADEGVDMDNGASRLVLQGVIVASNGGDGVHGDLAVGSPDAVTWFANAGNDCDACSTGTAASFEDPLFVAPSLGDWRLRGASPSVDSGVATGFDRNGAAPGTFAGAGPDRGAGER